MEGALDTVACASGMSAIDYVWSCLIRDRILSAQEIFMEDR